MGEPMTVHVEVWPVAADEPGIWLLSGTDAWRSGPVMADNEPHSEVEYVLSKHDITGDATLIHSTSWRVDGPHLILTYIVVLPIDELAQDAWPLASPISLELINSTGKPFPYSPHMPPTPRYIDVLVHALRHLRFLLDTDTINTSVLNQYWQRHLSALKPALAAMYQNNGNATLTSE